MLRPLVITSLFILSIVIFSQKVDAQQASKIKDNTAINTSSPSKNATTADIVSSLEKPVTNQKIKTPPILTGSAELGFLYKTGNTNSSDMRTGLDLRFEKNQWLSLLNIDLLLKKADIINDNGNANFQTTDQKWTLSSQTNYSLDNKEKNYIYGNIWYEENEFNSFVYQNSVSTGWGRHWYKNSNASLWADIGPGFKRDFFKATVTEPERIADTWIVQAQILYIRKLGGFIELKQYFSAKQALRDGENSIYNAETTVTTKLISTLQLRFTFTLDYNSDVEANKENLDTQTAVTLVYSF
ncbi:MAG: hypothetical protein COB83_05890 [Gammaproteobacteria bacterium]|nr:MAG: hypothetical protein COB83_05890 [Gammaproteobacteria bacterium]